jgi:oligoribonuclease NrnB/cAMP/cGMP phosphodiesterase (DHH superfamily)
VNSDFREDIYLFTDSDLDGAGCYYVLRKILKNDFGHTQTSEKNFKETFLNLENKEKYKKIYICDLSVLEKNCDIIDLPNVVYINHRNVEKYNNIKTKNLRQESENASSCTLLLYKKLKEKITPPFTKEEKIFISYINDYDNYDLKFPESLKLHYLICSYEGDRLAKFYNSFEGGFKGFNDVQETKIKNISETIDKTFFSLKAFKGDVKIGGNTVSVCSTFNTIFPSEICAMLIKKYNCDIAISVNMNTSNVSIRKSKACSVNLGKFAAKIFNGGGDDCVAGGKITKEFLQLTKLLYPIV